MIDKSTIAELAREAQVEERIIVRYLNQGETFESIRHKLRLDRPPELRVADMDLATCHALWLAVIHQTFLDYKRDEDKLRQWCDSRDFPIVCTLAGLDPAWAQKRLVRKRWSGHRSYVFYTKGERGGV